MFARSFANGFLDLSSDTHFFSKLIGLLDNLAFSLELVERSNLDQSALRCFVIFRNTWIEVFALLASPVVKADRDNVGLFNSGLDTPMSGRTHRFPFLDINFERFVLKRRFTSGVVSLYVSHQFLSMIAVCFDPFSAQIVGIRIQLFRAQPEAIVSQSDFIVNVPVMTVSFLIDHVGDEVDLLTRRGFDDVTFAPDPGALSLLSHLETQIPRIEDRLLRPLDLFYLDNLCIS